MPNESSSKSSGPQPTDETNDTGTIDQDHFKKHVIQLFGGERGGHMARWVYLDIARGGDLNSGSELWSAFVDAAQEDRNGYYLTKEEIALLEAPGTVDALQHAFKSATRVIDFGSGNRHAVERKAMPIVKGLASVKVYTPFDISAKMLAEAESAANDNLSRKKGMRVIPVHGDFSSGKGPESHEFIRFDDADGENRLGLMLGSTITNQEMAIDEAFPRAEIIEKLRTLARLLNNGSEGPPTGEHGLVVGYDSNLNEVTASEAYDDPIAPKLWAPLVTGVMFDIKKVLDPQPWSKNGGVNGFDPQAWHHERHPKKGPPLNPSDPDGTPAWIVMHQCVVADADQDFQIENGHPRRFQVKKGDVFVVKNNFKFHPLFFRQLAREAGFNPREAITMRGETTEGEKPNTAVLQPLIVSY